MRRRVANASAWALGTVGVRQVIHLIGHLLLAFFLVPEHFGVLALVRVVLMGLEQLSDVGVRSLVVFHKRGEELSFLHTAWTIRVLRGVFLWLVCLAIAWPMASFYGAEDAAAHQLLFLLPVAGLEGVAKGLMSANVFARQRRMKLRGVAIIQWAGAIATLVVMVVWAWLDPSPWAMVAGRLTGTTTVMILSHTVLKGPRMRFRLERESARDLIEFGKWIMLGTLTVYLAQQFDRLFLAKLIPLSVLGVYSLGRVLVMSLTKIVTGISNQVLIPLFSEYARSEGVDHGGRLRSSLGRFLPACLFLTVGAFCVSPAFFGYLYKDDYAGAGYFARWSCIVVWFMILQHVPRSGLLSLGDSRSNAVMTFANAGVTIIGCLAGYWWGNRLGAAVEGVILGTALGNVSGCLAGAMRMGKHGIHVGVSMIVYTLAALGIGAVILGFEGAALNWSEAQATAVMARDALPPRWTGWVDWRTVSVASTLLTGIPLAILVWTRLRREGAPSEGKEVGV